MHSSNTIVSYSKAYRRHGIIHHRHLVENLLSFIIEILTELTLNQFWKHSSENTSSFNSRALGNDYLVSGTC